MSWTFIGRDGKSGMVNYAAQGYDDLMRLIESRIYWSGANLYVAMGTQRLVNMEKAASNDGFPRASRRHNNMVSYKSIQLDLDVKPGAYATTEDAYAALDDFCTTVGLPTPSMEVLSGSGGIHVYWCTELPFSYEEWVPLAKGLRDAAVAYGLKCDPNVTVNPVGILRVPGSWNHKSVPPKPVTLVFDEDVGFPIYNYQLLVNALGQYVGPLAGVRSSQHKIPNVHALNQSGINQNFSAGVAQSPPVSIDEVAAVCPVIDDMLLRGGNGDAEPLWNIGLMLASFTDDPTNAAHRLGNQDPRYTQAGTDKKLAEKVTARQQNAAIGWPHCTSFSPLHPLCKQCPLFAQGKSPIHFAVAAKTTLHGPIPGADPLMPGDYWRDNSFVVYTRELGVDGAPETVKVMGDYPILDAGIDPKNNNLVIHTIIGGAEKWGSVTVGNSLAPLSAAQAFSTGAGVYIAPRYHKTIRNFIVPWMTHLQGAKKFIAPKTYGWTEDDDGFTFDETTYKTDGSKEVAFRGTTLDDRFVARGKLKPWQDALKLVQGNPALETVVASSFAAPLVKLVGSVSLVMSIYSSDSGNGKTTALTVAQAVWGNPRTGMSSLSDTNNSVIKKISDLNSLPIYWDELRTQDQMQKAIELVFAVTQGKAKSRLTRDIAQASAPAFTTLLAVASNSGIGDTVYYETGGTEAGGLRVFEMEVPRLKATMDEHVARDILIPLQVNYGVAGAQYAAFLAKNRATIKQMVMAMNVNLQKRYNLLPKERFWAMTMNTLLVGATLANASGLAQLNVEAIEQYLDQEFLKQRGELTNQAHSTLADDDSVLGLLTDLKRELRGKNMIITKVIHSGAGKPVPAVPIDTELAKLQDVWLQVGADDNKMRMSMRTFDEWLRKRRLQPKQVMKKLEKYYIVDRKKLSIGAGVQFIGSASDNRGMCYDLTPKPTFPGSNLDEPSQ